MNTGLYKIRLFGWQARIEEGGSSRMGVPTRSPRVGGGFWPLAVALPLLMAASVAPAPLYVVYQHRWGFSPVVLTVIYAVYMGPLVGALLVVGGLSDLVGRRPVIVTALVMQAASMFLLMTASGVPSLIIARLVQGLACGAALGAVTSGLLDLAPARHQHLGARLNGAGPAIGIGGGAALSGVLVQFAPYPDVLVYVVLAVGFVVAAGATALRVESVPHRPAVRASFRPRLGVPVGARRTFAFLLPGVVAAAAMGGFYNSLSGSVITQILGQPNRALAGLAITALQVCSVVASLISPPDAAPWRLVQRGSAALALGLLALGASLWIGSEAGYFLATAVAGAGYGVLYMGAIRVLAQVAQPGQRAGPLAALNVVNYLSLSVPTVLVGQAATWFGLRPTAIVLCLVLAILACAAVVHPRTSAPVSSDALASTEPTM
jgi:MFS family permease